MPSKGGKGGGSRGLTVSTAPRPALGRSTVMNFEGLEKVQLVVAAGSNEWGATQIWPGSWPRDEVASPAVPLHIPAFLSGVLPPFSSFLGAVLLHYQIHALHLDPSSLLLLSALAFLCEAFVGVTPSMALLHHFFSLELVFEEQCSGCASLKADDASVPWALTPSSSPEAEGFRWQWVQVKTAEVLPLAPDILRELLRRLIGDDPDELPQSGLPLYNFKAPEVLVVEMPLFDE
ncbi:hypothetical protein D1007_19672 [Hordeum vulgare]|nr:hypothetical protein D1007_19672 [Hordeum vulgare]